MSNNWTDDLPEVLKTVQTRPLLVMRLDVKKLQIVGETPTGYRRVGVVPGGIFGGERLTGKVLDGGSDWQTLAHDGATHLDVRLVLKTDDDVLIGMKYKGRRYGSPEILSRIDNGEVVDPNNYYFRILPVFETSGSAYLWLNHLVAVGVGHRLSDGPVYSVFEVL